MTGSRSMHLICYKAGYDSLISNATQGFKVVLMEQTRGGMRRSEDLQLVGGINRVVSIVACFQICQY